MRGWAANSTRSGSTASASSADRPVSRVAAVEQPRRAQVGAASRGGTPGSPTRARRAGSSGPADARTTVRCGERGVEFGRVEAVQPVPQSPGTARPAPAPAERPPGGRRRARPAARGAGAAGGPSVARFNCPAVSLMPQHPGAGASGQLTWVRHDERPGRRPGRSSIVVEVAGIEPASVGAEPGLLRAQPAVAFLSPGDLAGESPSRAQSLLMSPRAPRPGPRAVAF